MKLKKILIEKKKTIKQRIILMNSAFARSGIVKSPYEITII
jgi:hypothetical protein